MTGDLAALAAKLGLDGDGPFADIGRRCLAAGYALGFTHADAGETPHLDDTDPGWAEAGVEAPL